MWCQVYDPLLDWRLSTALAASPLFVLMGLLALGVSALRSAVAGLTAALLVAIVGFSMPTSLATTAAANGAAFGLFPIGWIVLAAVFLFRLTLGSGHFEIVKQSVASLSPDRRVQALLIAFSFGAFLEGAAGFGTPVAISAAMMIGLGFAPRLAAGLALIANTAPVAFGGLGIPILTLASMVEPDPTRRDHVAHLLSAMAGRQLPFFALLIPAWMVWILAGWRGVVGIWPAILVSGGSFATIQFLLANFHGPSLVDVVGGIGSLLCLAVFLLFWKPREVWRLPEDEPLTARPTSNGASARLVTLAWAPWIILTVVLFVWGLKDFNDFLRRCIGGEAAVPGLHNSIVRGDEIAFEPLESRVPEKALYGFYPLAATGTGILTAAILSALLLQIRVGTFLRTFAATALALGPALTTIACMMALAFTSKYCGSDATLGLAFTRTGWLYPFFAPLLGWVGVALTGSDTSSNALFGGLQKITADKLGLDPTLIVASNSTGGVMGKMIDAQSIVVAAVATGQNGQEGSILRFVLPHSCALACLVGLLTLLQAYWLTWMIPAF